MWWPMGPKWPRARNDAARGGFSSSVIKGTTGMGRGRSLGPVGNMVSVLETTVEAEG
jgi:hypothetical protein